MEIIIILAVITQNWQIVLIWAEQIVYNINHVLYRSCLQKLGHNNS